MSPEEIEKIVAYLEGPDTIRPETLLDFAFLAVADQYRTKDVLRLFQAGASHSWDFQLQCEKCGFIGSVSVQKTALERMLTWRKNKDFPRNYRLCKKCFSEAMEQEEVAKQKILQENQATNTEKSKDDLDRFGTYVDPTKSWNALDRNTFRGMCAVLERLDQEFIRDYIKSIQYSDFLKTPYWKAIAFHVKSTAGFKCSLCASKVKLVAHHKNYDYHGMEHTFKGLSSLICLCLDCHNIHHTQRSTSLASNGTGENQ